MENFASNNGGQYPCWDSTAWGCTTSTSASYTNYINNYFTPANLKDPTTGSAYQYTFGAGKYVSSSDMTQWYLDHPQSRTVINSAIQAQCEGSHLVARSSLPMSSVGTAVILENGTYCLDNS